MSRSRRRWPARQASAESERRYASRDGNAFVQRAGRGAGPATVAGDHTRPHQGGLREARARRAPRVPLLVPGSDRAARRARAHPGEGSGAAHPPLAGESAPQAPGVDPALGARDRRGRRSRGGARRREALAGRQRPVPAGSRHDSAGRRAAARGAQARRRAGAGTRLVRTGADPREQRSRRGAQSLPARRRRRPAQRRGLDQLRKAAARARQEARGG